MSENAEKTISALINDAVDHFEDDYCESISTLHSSPNIDVLNASIVLCHDANAIKRIVGALILGQLGDIDPAHRRYFLDERFEALHGLLVREMSENINFNVISRVCFALGHLHDAKSIPTISLLSNHPDDDIRQGVVAGLFGYEDDLAVETLIKLSNDANDDVRNLATFGLAEMIKMDTPSIRETLYARLSDAVPEIRNDAIAGLAQRKDPAVLDHLIAELSRQVATPLFEAASYLSDPRLLKPLLGAKDIGQPWPEHFYSSWEMAVVDCSST